MRLKAEWLLFSRHYKYSFRRWQKGNDTKKKRTPTKTTTKKTFTKRHFCQRPRTEVKKEWKITLLFSFVCVFFLCFARNAYACEQFLHFTFGARTVNRAVPVRKPFSLDFRFRFFFAIRRFTTWIILIIHLFWLCFCVCVCAILETGNNFIGCAQCKRYWLSRSIRFGVCMWFVERCKSFV